MRKKEFLLEETRDFTVVFYTMKILHNIHPFVTFFFENSVFSAKVFPLRGIKSSVLSSKKSGISVSSSLRMNGYCFSARHQDIY